MPVAMSRAQNLEATAVFRNTYDGYQKMAASDYLEHSLLFGCVKKILKDQDKPLRILDLGCGDSGNVVKILADLPAASASYTGVDMSESALKTAQSNVQDYLSLSFPASFHVSDMLSFLKQTIASYDVVLAAFALHHLTPEDKEEALKEVKRVLSPKGIFIMVDPFRREGEDLPAYRRRAAEVGETWVCMGKDRQAEFIQHMLDYDIVEPEAFYDIALKKAGFTEKTVLCRGQKGLQSNVTVFKQ